MDMSQFTHKVLMLRPMSNGAAGFVRLMNRRGHVVAEVHVKGLGREGVRAWLLTGEEAAELGSAEAHRGEAVLHGEFPAKSLAEEKMQAIVVLREDGSRRPLLLGLISGPETMTHARTACLALSKRLREKAIPLPRQPVQEETFFSKTEKEARNVTIIEENRPCDEAEMAVKTKTEASDAEAPTQANSHEITLQKSSRISPPVGHTAPPRNPLHREDPFSHKNDPRESAGAAVNDTLLHSAPPSGIQCPIAPTSCAKKTTCTPFTSACRRPGKNLFTLRRPVPWQIGAQPLPMEEIRRAMDAAGKLSLQGESKKKRRKGKASPGAEMPQEVYFPAIDPLPYVAAEEASPKPEAAVHATEPPARTAEEMRPCTDALPERPVVTPEERIPADALPELIWPPQFESVKEIFLYGQPCGRFRLPGWRFVRAGAEAEGLWIGRQTAEGRVIRIAYIRPGPPEEGSDYQPLTGTDGRPYRALVQRI